MRLDCRRSPDLDRVVYTLTIDGGELTRAALTRHDRMLLSDCQSEDATISDTLLGLELIARRIEQTATERTS